MCEAPWIASFVLGLGLLLELFAWVALFSRGSAAVTGILLITFHLTVSKVMSLTFDRNIMVLLIYFVQVPFWIAWVALHFAGKRKIETGARPPVRGTLRGTLAACTPMIALTVLLLVLRENYPFSHFPMYSSFSRHTYYVYVKDRRGDPIPVLELSGIRTSSLKKIYNTRLKKTLKDLRDADPGEGKRLSLYGVLRYRQVPDRDQDACPVRRGVLVLQRERPETAPHRPAPAAFLCVAAERTCIATL